MDPSWVLFLAFLIGVIAGLRTMTAPAVVAWAANRHWLNLYTSPLAFMGSTAAVGVFTLLALGELVFDTLPSTRTAQDFAADWPKRARRSVRSGCCGRWDAVDRRRRRSWRGRWNRRRLRATKCARAS